LQFIAKLAANNVNLVFRKESGANELLAFSIMLLSGVVSLVNVILDKTANSANIQITSVYEKVIPLVNHALAMIVNL
jgi:hypothetical protein